MQIDKYEAKKNDWLRHIRDKKLTSIQIKDIKFKGNFDFEGFPIIDMLILVDKSTNPAEIKFIRPAEDYLFNEARKLDADVFPVFLLDFYPEDEHRSLTA